MERRDVFEYAKQQYGTEPDYPWNDWNAVLRHKVTRKWYGIIMKIDRKKLDSECESMVIDVLNIKCDSMLIGSLRMQPGFYPAYHMNKENWISVCLDNSVSDDKLKELIDMSFEMTKLKNDKNQYR